MLDLTAIFDVEDPVLIWGETEIGVANLPLDWRVRFEERAGIKQYHGGLSREQADEEALAEILEQMKLAGILRN